MKKKLIYSLIFICGVFYLFSGIIKIIDIDNFLFLIRFYNIKPFIYLAPIIPVIEINVGLLLIMQIRVKQVILFSILLLSFFTLIFAYGHFFKNIDDCGCFGGIDFLKTSPVVFFIRNGIFIFTSIFIYDSLKTEDTKLLLYKLILISVLVIVSSVVVGLRSNLSTYLAKTPYTRSNIDDYHENFFVNKNINETILSRYVSTSKDSTYLVFIFSYKCPHCVVSSFNINEYVENNIVDQILGITKGTRKEERFFIENVKTNFQYKRIKFIEINEITGFYPLSFYVDNDTIRFKIKGGLPKHDKFKNLYLN